MSYKEILDTIEKEIEGEAHLDELAKKRQNPFKILISTILSARTKDINTKLATDRLFAKYTNPKSIAEADIEILEDLIRVSGFFKVKAARIKEVSKVLIEEYNGEVPNNYEKLLALPGVGSKTAKLSPIFPLAAKPRPPTI